MCRPRTTPRWDRDRLSCTNSSGSSPASLATAASNVRLKNPRSSRCSGAVKRISPEIAVFAYSIAHPSALVTEIRISHKTGPRPRPSKGNTLHEQSSLPAVLDRAHAHVRGPRDVAPLRELPGRRPARRGGDLLPPARAGLSRVPAGAAARVHPGRGHLQRLRLLLVVLRLVGAARGEVRRPGRVPPRAG